MTGMTKDYAIAILRRMQEPEPFEPQINESAFDALEMAIQALSAQDTDVVSRKAALDAIHKYFGSRIENGCPSRLVDGEEIYISTSALNALLAINKALSRAIKELPAALPDVPNANVGDMVSRQAVIDAIVTWTVEDRPDVEMPTDLIDRIRNLTSAQSELAQNLHNACTDLISRQAAIDVLEERLQANDYSNVALVSELNRSIGYLMQLPSAQPEPDTALYVEGFNDGYKQGKNDAQLNVARDIATIIENEKDMRVILAQPETAKRIVGKSRDGMTLWYQCDMCNEPVDAQDNFCRGCGRRLTDG